MVILLAALILGVTVGMLKAHLVMKSRGVPANTYATFLTLQLLRDLLTIIAIGLMFLMISGKSPLHSEARTVIAVGVLLIPVFVMLYLQGRIMNSSHK